MMSYLRYIEKLLYRRSRCPEGTHKKSRAKILLVKAVGEPRGVRGGGRTLRGELDRYIDLK